jgi:PAS domain S-box-containing protein
MHTTGIRDGQLDSHGHEYGVTQATVRILVVDDDPDFQINLRELLHSDGYELVMASLKSEIQRRRDWAEFAVVLLDRVLRDGCTDDVLPQIRAMAPETAVIVITGHKEADAAIAAVQNGAVDYLVKPIKPDVLKDRLQRVVANRRLRQTAAHLAAIVESSNDAIIGLTLNGVVASWNAAAVRLYGYAAEEALGRPISMVLPAGSTDEFGRIVGKIAQGESVEQCVCDHITADGRTVHVSLAVSPVRNWSGSSIAGSWIARDITNLKRMEEQLREAERIALQTRMVAVLAHMGRNALQRIYARLELLATRVVDRSDCLEHLQRMESACDDLHAIQESILAYLAPLKLVRERASLAGIWQKAWSDLAPAHASRDVLLQERTTAVDLDLSVDAFRLAFVFRSLFENSLAACADPVRVNIECRSSQIDGRDALEIVVSDNGPGLSPDDERHLFEPFFTTKVKATGLGLALSKRIIEAHHGSISLVKNHEAGTAIMIRLPRFVSPSLAE